MNVKVLAGSAHPALAAAVRDALGGGPAPGGVERFPDGEVRARVDASVAGADVYLVQPTPAPAGEHLLEVLLLADACRRAGAARVSAVVPYFGYARQDRRTRPGEAVGARVVAEVLGTAGLARLLAVDVHSAALEGVLAMPLEPLSAVPRLVDAVRPHAGSDAVVVAPDVGAVKLARRYASALGLPTAVVHKQRVSGTQVSVREVVGDVAGRRPILVDDMVSTGGTIVAAAEALRARGATADFVVVATHALLVDAAVDRLAALPLRRLVTTDSLPPGPKPPFARDVVSLAPMLAEAIARLSGGHPLGDLLALR